MKKWLVYAGAGLLVLSLASCGGEAGGNGSQSAEQTEGTDAAQDSVESSASGDEPEESGATEDSTPGESGGNAEYEDGWSQEMEGLKAAVVEQLGDDYWPDMALLPDMLEMTFGITADMYEDYMAEMPMISANVDTLLIVRAKDDKVEAVREALDAYREAQIGDTLQYPMNVGKVQASRIETLGNYVVFVQLGADTEAAGDDDEAVIKMCQETNDSVIETIRAQLGQ